MGFAWHRACARSPEDFEILCRVPVTFRYADKDAVLEHYTPLIELGPDRWLLRTVFHDRSDQLVAGDVDRLDATIGPGAATPT